MQILPSATPDLAPFIRTGDRVVCGQASAEPAVLTAGLAAAHDTVGPFETFLGAVFSHSFDHAPAGMRFASYGAMGRASRLARQGRLDCWPIHYSTLEAGFASGAIRADVVLIQLARGPGGYSATLANDYVLAAARHARSVIAEINAAAPWCAGAELDPDLRIDLLIETQREPVPLEPAPAGETEARIARHVAALIPDRATVQIGIGAIPDAVLGELGNHRGLGIHSGVIGDRVAALVQAGAVTNAHKTADPGLTVGNVVAGTSLVRDFIDKNNEVRLRPAGHTHAAAILAAQDNFVAVNSAIEVDLSGQANAEVADGMPVGGTGGLLDFTRGARAARGGRAILALRATDRTGTVSRIVPRVAAVTMPRSDIDTVVTEFGVAEIGHLAPAGRARALIAIAAPRHREMLERYLAEGDRL